MAGKKSAYVRNFEGETECNQRNLDWQILDLKKAILHRWVNPVPSRKTAASTDPIKVAAIDVVKKILSKETERYEGRTAAEVWDALQHATGENNDLKTKLEEARQANEALPQPESKKDVQTKLDIAVDAYNVIKKQAKDELKIMGDECECRVADLKSECRDEYSIRLQAEDRVAELVRFELYVRDKCNMVKQRFTFPLPDDTPSYYLMDAVLGLMTSEISRLEKVKREMSTVAEESNSCFNDLSNEHRKCAQVAEDLRQEVNRNNQLQTSLKTAEEEIERLKTASADHAQVKENMAKLQQEFDDLSAKHEGCARVSQDLHAASEEAERIKRELSDTKGQVQVLSEQQATHDGVKIELTTLQNDFNNLKLQHGECAAVSKQLEDERQRNEDLSGTLSSTSTRVEEVGRQLKKLEDRNDDLVKEVKLEGEERANQRAALQAAEDKNKQCNKQLQEERKRNETLNETLTSTQTAVARLERQLKELEAQNKELNEDITREKSQRSGIETALETAEGVNKKNTELLQNVNAKIDEVQSKAKEVETALQDSRKRGGLLTRQVSDLQRQSAEHQQKSADANNILAAERSSWSSERERLKGEVHELEQKNEKMSAGVKRLEEEKKTLNGALRHSVEKSTKMEQRIKEYDEMGNRLRGERQREHELRLIAEGNLTTTQHESNRFWLLALEIDDERQALQQSIAWELYRRDVNDQAFVNRFGRRFVQMENEIRSAVSMVESRMTEYLDTFKDLASERKRNATLRSQVTTTGNTRKEEQQAHAKAIQESKDALATAERRLVEQKESLDKFQAEEKGRLDELNSALERAKTAESKFEETAAKLKSEKESCEELEQTLSTRSEHLGQVTLALRECNRVIKTLLDENAELRDDVEAWKGELCRMAGVLLVQRYMLRKLNNARESFEDLLERAELSGGGGATKRPSSGDAPTPKRARALTS